MHRMKQTSICSKWRWYGDLKSQKCGTDLGSADLSSKLMDKAAVDNGVMGIARKLQGISKSGSVRQYFDDFNHMTMDMHQANGISVLKGKWVRECRRSILPPMQITGKYGPCSQLFRLFSSTASDRRGKKQSENKKDISTVEDPFDSPTYNIPEKPVTFAEGASYSFVILAGLGVAAVAAYAVFKELIFEPKEYKIFGKALERVKNDGQVKVRIGTPITGYGQESRNRAARQRIPNRTWTDENGIEHVEINFHIRGPRGAGIVYAVMYKDKADKQWKYTSLIVQIKSPSPAQLILESYIPT